VRRNKTSDFHGPPTSSVSTPIKRPYEPRYLTPEEQAAALYRKSQFRSKSTEQKYAFIRDNFSEWADDRPQGVPYLEPPFGRKVGRPSFKHIKYGNDEDGGLAVWPTSQSPVPPYINILFANRFNRTGSGYPMTEHEDPRYAATHLGFRDKE
jgi:hypothetical protein